jgi:uncharacterized membrane protein YkvA (DUF1232 family)
LKGRPNLAGAINLDDQLPLYPDGLTREQFTRLSDYANYASRLTLSELQQAAQGHLQDTARARQQNPLVNLRLATALCDAIHAVGSAWVTLPPGARNWLAGAILYFASSDDEEPDFASPIGFEDDVEVLNACLRFAHLDRLCLNPEDYDDA